MIKFIVNYPALSTSTYLRLSPKLSPNNMQYTSTSLLQKFPRILHNNKIRERTSISKAQALSLLLRILFIVIVVCSWYVLWYIVYVQSYTQKYKGFIPNKLHLKINKNSKKKEFPLNFTPSGSPHLQLRKELQSCS